MWQLFLLDPLDERSTRWDESNQLSYWQHGDVRVACQKPNCIKCDGTCKEMNMNVASLSFAFRSCFHSRIIDCSTSVEPLEDNVRSELGLGNLQTSQVNRNNNAIGMLKGCKNSGGDLKFN